MASSLTACVVFIAAFFSAGGVPLKEDDPLVAKVKQIVANVNSYLEENKQGQIQLPDVGNFSVDNIVLTNLKLSNFSTMEFLRGPFVEQNQSLSTFNVTLRLQTFNYQFDFDVNTNIKQKGHMTLTPQDNYYLIEGLVEISQNKSCQANLTTIDFDDYGHIQIDTQPDNIPDKDEMIQQIFSLISPTYILWSIYALEIIASVPSFYEDMSNIICHVLVS